MKKPGRFFLWIALLAGGLLISITIAQIVTQNSLSRLRQGNEQATSTITMNNRLQEMVNLAFELESKLLADKPASLISPKRGIKDSLARLEYNINIIEKAWPDTVLAATLKKLSGFIKHQVGISFSVLNAAEKKNDVLQKKLSDSLRNRHCGDSIYSSAISFQKGLEQNLNITTTENNNAALQLSFLNRLLAGVALLAVLVLATIIIRRQVKQLSLIKALQEARKVALQSAEAKDQFLANMSHEIRTPLNAIKGFGRILLQTPLNEQQQKYSSIITTASENLLNIVNDVLDFSKIEAGNMVMKERAFMLNEVISQVGLMFTPLAQEKELMLIFSPCTAIPDFVKGDPERLRQILVNLLSNAIKFTNKGTVTLSVNCNETIENTIKTKFTIIDTGVGIPEEKIDLIFERFEQLDHSFTRQQGGTGLGLAITKKLVEAMGGRIAVKSEVNKGSVFTIELEFDQVINIAAGEELITPSNSTDNACFKNLEVLVAEDNKMNQLLVKTILEKCNVKVEITENGEEALAAMRKKQFDLVLMDVQMPKKDGITATKILRKEINSTMPVIAMTAHVLPGEREKCIAAGMNDYLSKPLDEDEVIRVLKKYCSMKRNGKASVQITSATEWINMSYLKSICGNDADRIKAVLEELKKQLPAEAASLNRSLQDMQPTILKKICHHLKSTLSPFEQTSLPVITLGELSGLLNHGKTNGQVKEKANKLVSEIEKAMEEVNRVLAGEI